MSDEQDTKLRLAAVEHVRRVSSGGAITSDDLNAGFKFDGQRIALVNPQRGIFKPAKMKHLLSVRTVYPVSGRKVWYDDQREVHAQIERGEELIDYAFMGTDPTAADNRWLKDAMEFQIPVLYFLGVAPRKYSLMFPTYVVDWSATELKARLAFGAPSYASVSYVAPAALSAGTRCARRGSAYTKRHSVRPCLLRTAVVARSPVFPSRAYWMRRTSSAIRTRRTANLLYPTACPCPNFITQPSTRT